MSLQVLPEHEKGRSRAVLSQLPQNISRQFRRPIIERQSDDALIRFYVPQDLRREAGENRKERIGLPPEGKRGEDNGEHCKANQPDKNAMEHLGFSWGHFGQLCV